ncbi:hypothetical protein GCM10010401_19020 [Rarobacter faecitabidus]|uniref:Uncharacterized protein n=1 Tax=Rarobacter faecitabidus TaxID=13243 RepID=A0A542ZUV0_RARFA|nr:hypothetical protein [Rarobacter faecitabidus]TQL64112.1 hypothetical protein FB461_0597 [Rarobacter faecitabidus]
MVTDDNAKSTPGSLPEVIEAPTRRARRAAQAPAEQAVPFTRRQMRERAAQLAAEGQGAPSAEPTPPSAQHRQRHGTPTVAQPASIPTPAGPTRRQRRAVEHSATPASGIASASSTPVAGGSPIGLDATAPVPPAASNPAPSLAAAGGPLTRAEARVRARAMAAAAAAIERDTPQPGPAPAQQQRLAAPSPEPLQDEGAGGHTAPQEPATRSASDEDVMPGRTSGVVGAGARTAVSASNAGATVEVESDRPLTRRELRERARALGVETSAIQVVPEASGSSGPGAPNDAGAPSGQSVRSGRRIQAGQGSSPDDATGEGRTVDGIAAPSSAAQSVSAEPSIPEHPLTRRELRARKLAETGAIPRVKEPIVEPPPGTGAIRAVDETGQLQPIRPLEQTGPLTELPVAGHLQRPDNANITTGRLPRQPDLSESPAKPARPVSPPRSTEDLAAQWAMLAADSGLTEIVRPGDTASTPQPRATARPATAGSHSPDEASRAAWPQQSTAAADVPAPIWSPSLDSETDAEPIALDEPAPSTPSAHEPRDGGAEPAEFPGAPRFPAAPPQTVAAAPPQTAAAAPPRAATIETPPAATAEPPSSQARPQSQQLPVAEPRPASQPVRIVAPESRPTPIADETHAFDAKMPDELATRFAAPATGQTPVASPLFAEEDSSAPNTLATGSIPVVRAPIVSQPTPVLDRFLQGEDQETDDDDDADEHKGLNLLHWAIVVACALILGLVLWKGDFDSNGAPALEAPATSVTALQNPPPAE